MFNNIYEIVFLVEFVAVIGVRIYWTSRAAKSGSQRKKFGEIWRESPAETIFMFLSFFGMQVFPLIYVLTPWIDFADYPTLSWLRLLGAALFAAGIWLLWRSHADLAANWSASLEARNEQTLVTGGVFARIRHPMYSAHLLWAFGQALLLPNLLAGVLFLAVQVPLYAIRVPREERLLIERFGEPYREYMTRTGRFLPHLG
jgi:protein-S-isoprenylcysteine O-methyltransferase Ste14